MADEQAEGNMKPGTTRRFECGYCNREFDVTYEPKCKGAKAEKAKGIPEAPEPVFCPFCNANALEACDV